MNLKSTCSPADYIHSLGRFSGAPGLHRIRALLAALGQPQKRLRFVHLAGTNGKGSTATMTAEIVRQAGYRVGLFTSPYLVKFHERIQVNGVPIAEQDLARLTETVAQAAQTLTLPQGEHIGEYEFVTAVGMLYFAQQRCALVVLETGLGGAFDASNAIDPPLVAAITSISLDHTAVLGNTVAQIAHAKAGIIKPGSIVVCAAGQPQDALGVIEAACTAAGAPLRVPAQTVVGACSLSGTVFRFASEPADCWYTVKLPGMHQVQNAATAVYIAHALAERGFAITRAHIEAGLSAARILGRLQIVRDHPLTIIDGAHNPGGMEALCGAIDGLLQGRRLLVVLGMVRDKAVASCVDAIASRAATVFTAAPQNERAMDAASLAALARHGCAQVRDCGTIQSALAAAERDAQADDCILVCGSLYLAGEAENIFAARQKAPE